MSRFYPQLNEADNRSIVNRIKLGDLPTVTARDGTVIDLARLKKQIKQIKTLIVAQDQLFSPFVYELQDVYTWAVKTMATDGSFLFINPKWSAKLSFDECTFVIYHELFHCLLDHMKRGKAGSYNHKKFNYAADYEVNGIFADTYGSEYDIKQLYANNLEGILYNEKFVNLPAETIYDMIPNPPAKSRGGSGSGSGDGSDDDEDYDGGDEGENGEEDEEDDNLSREVEWEAGDVPGGMISPELGKKLAKKAGLSDKEIDDALKSPEDWTKLSKDLLNRALNQNKMSGGGAANMLTKILGNHHNSVIDWKKILSRIVGDIIAKKDLNWKMPNRRYSASDPDAIRHNPYMSGRDISRIIVCMDTSGSMQKELLQAIVDEINALLFSKKIKEIIVLFFDAAVKPPQVIRQGQRAYCPDVIGGGGTDFQVALDFIKEKYNDKLSLCLFFTDGYEAIPKKPSYHDKFIWIVYDNPNWPNTSYVGTNPAFGKKILVNTKSLEAGVKKKVAESVANIKKLVMESIKYYMK